MNERHGNGRSGGAAYAAHPTADAPWTSSGCGPAAPPPESTCCDLVCFERPRYFCGHLLTDADLSLDQRYVVEKQKLYHRALHGHGIVCGLRLACDPACKGHVIVGEGYAIDECGNDLVVCEPASFDVLGRLREKKLLVSSPRRDDCGPEQEPPDCRIRDCFYVVACYEEQRHDYSTPLTPSCGPSPRECEATRVRETVRFDVLDQLPACVDPLKDLRRRIERCFELFTDGPFAEALKDPLVGDAVAGRGEARRHGDLCNRLCRLRILLKRYLEEHPDHYHCTILEEIDAIRCPPDPGSGEGAGDDRYATEIRDAFCRLVDLAYGHVMACVMGELTPPCPDPAQASCIVLGTVEIVDGRIVRVCNCPRSYVWSFASFWPVLMGTLFGGSACEKPAGDGHERDQAAQGGAHDHGRDRDRDSHDDDECGCGCGALGARPCCRTFTPRDGCASYLETVRQGGPAVADVGKAVLDAVTSVRCALKHALDPTRTDTLLLGALRGMPVEQAMAALQRDQVWFRVEEAPPPGTHANPLDVLSAHFHQTRETRVIAHRRGDTIVAARPQTTDERVAYLEGRIEQLEKQIAALGPDEEPGPGEGDTPRGAGGGGEPRPREPRGGRKGGRS